jgi:NTE family protein
VTRIGLVLGAGGVVGQAFHAGVLAAIRDVTGWDPRQADFVVGTSAGSVAAASLRAGVCAEDLFARASGRPLTPAGLLLLNGVPAPPQSQPALEPRTQRVGPSSPELLGRLFARPGALRPGIAVSALLPEGRRDTTSWFAGFTHLFPEGRWPERPMWLCAVNLDEGRRVVFGTPGAPPATVSQAVQASCAIPAVFRPVQIGGARYVDGGVHSPTNADLLVAEGLDAVVVSSPMSADMRHDDLLSLARLRSATRLPAKVMLSREIRKLGEAGIPVLVFEPSASVIGEMGLQPMDFRRRAPVAEAAIEAAKQHLDGPEGREVGRVLMKGRS